ncbi:MAG: zinc ribbon domain-containing protein [Pyrinomonadaceae bacterium]
MKKCQTCSFENVDSMRFCVECGTPLPDAPIVVNLGNQSNMETAAFKSTETQAGGKGAFGNFPNQFSNVPPPKPRSNKKIFLVVGGILALFLLVFIAGAAIIGYNMMKDEVVKNPTPSPTASTSPAASTSPTKSPKSSPSPTDSPDDDDTPVPTNKEGEAEIEKMWVDYNVSEDGKKGMRIHVKFTVHGLKDTDSYLAIYFEKENGDKLYTNNKTYRSKDGQVAVYKSLKPAYKDAVYDDAQLFVPYDEFNLDDGKYNLKMDVDVIYENGDMFKHLKYYDFTYTEG